MQNQNVVVQEICVSFLPLKQHNKMYHPPVTDREGEIQSYYSKNLNDDVLFYSV